MNDTTMTRRMVVAGLAALPLARSLALPMVDNDDEPVWDFEIDLGGWGDPNHGFVSALERGSVRDGALPYLDRQEQDDWGNWMFRWPKREDIEQMGCRAWCEGMIADEGQEGRVGTVTVRRFYLLTDEGLATAVMA